MLIAFDFETRAIENRPSFPPKPVGLAILPDGSESTYFSWGHPGPNTMKESDVRPMLKELLADTSYEFVAHNLPFDACIIEEYFDIPFPWERSHDTMLQAFLLDPFGELSLKPLAEIHLLEPPSEQSAVRDWLVVNGVVRPNDRSWGAHIAEAPADFVAAYARADVRKTLALHKLFNAAMEKRK